MDVGPWEAANFKRGSSLLGIAKGFVPQNMYGGMKVHGGFWQMYKVSTHDTHALEHNTTHAHTTHAHSTSTKDDSQPCTLSMLTT
jgi:hypothetical protein